jgi:CO dehydrogenase nickel-insertion accessory protein CooC1
MSLRVGLTGGIGSGKSAVSAAFARLGVEIVDADALEFNLATMAAVLPGSTDDRKTLSGPPNSRPIRAFSDSTKPTGVRSAWSDSSAPIAIA